jgi:hypothetical protein
MLQLTCYESVKRYLTLKRELVTESAFTRDCENFLKYFVCHDPCLRNVRNVAPCDLTNKCTFRACPLVFVAGVQ